MCLCFATYDHDLNVNMHDPYCYHMTNIILEVLHLLVILLVQWDKINLLVKWLQTRYHLYLFYVHCSTSAEKLGRCWEKTRNWNNLILTDVKCQNSELFVATCLLWDNSCLLSWGYILVRNIIQMIDYGRNLPFSLKLKSNSVVWKIAKLVADNAWWLIVSLVSHSTFLWKVPLGRCGST